MARSASDPPPRELKLERANGLALGVPDAVIDAIAERTADLLAERLPDRPEPYLTVDEAAVYLACSPKRIYALKAEGRLGHFRDGSRLLFRRSDLDAALVRREAQ